MEKKEMNIMEAIKCKQAIDQLLYYPGIHYKKVYWLDRNRQKLMPLIKKWTSGPLKEIREKYEVEIPPTPFVRFTDYPKFKAELLAVMENPVFGNEHILAVLDKYEMAKDPKDPDKGIPLEHNNTFNKEIEEAAKDLNAEIEYVIIDIDKTLENALQNIPGEMVLALEFMLREPSALEIYKDPIH